MREYRPVTQQLIFDHLTGKEVIGIYPYLPEGTCRFLVFDFDNHTEESEKNDFANEIPDWIEEVNALRNVCLEAGVDPLIERSRSGRGAHVWIFFEKPLPVKKARMFGNALLQKGASSVSMKSFVYYDRMLPAQDVLPEGAIGNLIALPLQPEALRNGNSAFVDEAWNAYPQQWKVLLSKPKLGVEQVQNCIEEWIKENPFKESETASIRSKDSRNGKPWENRLQFHKEDVLGEMQIVLSDLTYVDTIQLQPRIQNQIRRLAAFGNPVFYKNQAMGLSNFANSRYIYLGEDDCGYIGIPRGLTETLIEKCKAAGILYRIQDERQHGRSIKATFTGTLRESQKRAVEKMLEHDTGILNAATAFGKTVVCCNLIAERKVNTLIILESSELIPQWEKAIAEFLMIDEEPPEYLTKTGRVKRRKSALGTLQGPRDTLTGIVDIAMAGSLCKKGEYHSLLQEYGMILLDESHHGASTTVQGVLREAKAKYVYGLTATPKREDGLEKKVFMQFGPIRFRYTAKERAEKQGIYHFVYPRFTRLVSASDLKVTEANRAVIECDSRNEQIIADVENCIQNGRTTLVLTKYKEHAQLLYQRLQGKADHVYLLQGGGSRKAKDEMRMQMRSVPVEESVVLVAIDKYIGEGFNFPRLDTMMLTMPAAAEGNIEQFAGRLHRDYESKTEVIIYDYVDSHIRVLEKMYHKRLRTYKKIGYEICNNILAQKQHANAIFDIDTYEKVFERDLLEANKEIIISSPGLNQIKVNAFVRLIKQKQEDGVKITVVTLNPEGYPEEKIEDTKNLVQILEKCAVKVRLQDYMHEHFAIIDGQIVWYGSMNLLSRAKADDNLMRVESKDAAQELLEITFG